MENVLSVLNNNYIDDIIYNFNKKIKINIKLFGGSCMPIYVLLNTNVKDLKESFKKTYSKYIDKQINFMIPYTNEILTDSIPVSYIKDIDAIYLISR